MNLLVLILVLLGGGGLSWASEKFSGKAPKWVSLGVLLLSSIVLLMLCQEKDSVGIFSQYYAPWIERFGISISLAMDGLSLALVSLTLLLGFVAVYSAWEQISERTGFFYFNLLWTLAGVVGVFTAFDLFLFFFFWPLV